tara:strand:+ start:586 stop:867 length:282 start_codon:yes stop_codon:yes gene_type:complete
MAHFCELDKNNIIKRILVVNNNELLEDGKEVENKGIEFLKNIFGQNTNWVQCSYNSNFRGFYPAPNDFYDKEKDTFVGRIKLPKDKQNIYFGK